MDHTGWARPLTASKGPEVNTSLPYEPWKRDRPQREAQRFWHLALILESGCMHACSFVSNLVTPMDCSLPGSSVRGILQARILGWDAISPSRGSSRPRKLQACLVSCSSFTGRQILDHRATWESRALACKAEDAVKWMPSPVLEQVLQGHLEFSGKWKS